MYVPNLNIKRQYNVNENNTIHRCIKSIEFHRIYTEARAENLHIPKCIWYRFIINMPMIELMLYLEYNCWAHWSDYPMIRGNTFRRYEIVAPCPYLIRRFIVRSRKVSKSRDLFLELRNLTGTSVAVRPMCLSNFKATWYFKLAIPILHEVFQ